MLKQAMRTQASAAVISKACLCLWMNLAVDKPIYGDAKLEQPLRSWQTQGVRLEVLDMGRYIVSPQSPSLRLHYTVVEIHQPQVKRDTADSRLVEHPIVEIAGSCTVFRIAYTHYSYIPFFSE